MKKNPDGTPSGFGFCEYDSPETAQNAVKILQGVKYNNRTLKIGYSDKTKSSRGDTTIPLESKSLKDLLKELVDSIPNRELTNIIRKWEDIRDHNSLYYDYMKDFPQLKRALQQFEQSFKNISSGTQKRKRDDRNPSSQQSDRYYSDPYSQPSKRYNTGQDYSYPPPPQQPYQYNDPCIFLFLLLFLIDAPPPQQQQPSPYYYDRNDGINPEMQSIPPNYTDPYSIPPIQQQQPPPPSSITQPQPMPMTDTSYDPRNQPYYPNNNNSNIPDQNPYYTQIPPPNPIESNYKMPSDPRL